jgi:hypothetical protein
MDEKLNRRKVKWQQHTQQSKELSSSYKKNSQFVMYFIHQMNPERHGEADGRLKHFQNQRLPLIFLMRILVIIFFGIMAGMGLMINGLKT